MNKTLTVFTPTFNRCELLRRCYESLENQTSKDFIWQIVDDGSTDNTKSFVKEIMQEAIFPIEYIYKENGGKISAINKSVETTKTEAWVCLDSDDWLVENAVDEIVSEFNTIKDDSRLCGLFAVRSNPDLTPMGGRSIPTELKHATQSYVRYKLRIPPEYVQVYKTSILKQYSFPVIPGENYMPLSYITDQMDLIYKYKMVFKPLMICEYLGDGITRNHQKIIAKNPCGYILFQRQRMELENNLGRKIKACIAYNTGCILARNDAWLKDTPFKVLVFLTMPLGMIDYVVRYRKYCR